MITQPPINDITLNNLGKFQTTWIRWLQSVYRSLSGGEPLPIASYTVLTLPPATGFPSLIYVSNAAGGAIPAFNDGTNWRRVDTRAIIT